MKTDTMKPNDEPATAAGVVSTALLGRFASLCGECGAKATWHADHCEAGRAYYCGRCVAIPNRDRELNNLRRFA